MKVLYPDWALEDTCTRGQFQCGGCFMVMNLQGEGEPPNVQLGFRHHHHEKCVLAEKSGDFEYLPVKLGSVAALLLHPDQPTEIIDGPMVPPFPDLRDPP